MKLKTKEELNKIPTQEKFEMPLWAIGQHRDKYGVVYDVCEHYYMHPNQKWLEKYNLNIKGDGIDHSIHKCDGCCSKFIIELKTGKLKIEEPDWKISTLAHRNKSSKELLPLDSEKKHLNSSILLNKYKKGGKIK